MNNKKIFIIIVIILIFFGGWLLLRSDNTTMPTDEEIEVDEGAAQNNEDMEEDAGQTRTHTILYTDKGFDPTTLTVNVGDTVIWKNESTSQVWVASAIHPTHTAYPNSNIQKCGTTDEGSFFDQCGGVSFGSEYHFIFDQEGEWGYHNHLRTSDRARVIVE